MDTSPCPKPVVESVNLVVVRERQPSLPQTVSEGSINFKKFRKVISAIVNAVVWLCLLFLFYLF